MSHYSSDTPTAAPDGDDCPPTTPQPEGALPDSAAAAADFAERLGPASRRQVALPASQAAIAARVAAGRNIEDAVLAELHAHLSDNRQLADEFAAFFLYDLMKLGQLSMTTSSRLRRFLDTGDLVLSVFGDVWGDVAGLRFDTRQQFNALFAKRLDWKAADQARRLGTQRRADDRRVDTPADELELAHAPSESAPLSNAIREEEREQLILLLLRLKERDRRLLTAHLKGRSPVEIAAELGIEVASARRALERAIAQARALAARSG